ncbi:MAG: recombinase family protein [Fibrobacteres bacterium]|nr:recombinase family protein [Fibrobacterota bacterium]
MNDSRIPSARGGKWYAGTIRYILANKIYDGETSYKDIKHQKTHLIINQAVSDSV